MIRTDHSALQWLRRTPNAIGQQARWLEILEEFDYQIEHRPSKKHTNADGMSRIPCRQCGLEEDDTAPVSVGLTRALFLQSGGTDDDDSWSSPNLAEASRIDPELSTFYKLFSENDGQAPWADVVGSDKISKSYWVQWDRLRLHEGVLYRLWESADGLHKRWQLIPPMCYREELIRRAHTGATGGHLGVRKTLAQVQLRAYWCGWNDEVARFCRSCEECARYHRGSPKKLGPLQIFPVGQPMERIEIPYLENTTSTRARATVGASLFREVASAHFVNISTTVSI